ncbi:MAG TPA: AtpZ/AtpI family protein [Anaerolineae bacterium]|nr:AtpZ/AtpI family protein [Anaerolineae bacterium]
MNENDPKTRPPINVSRGLVQGSTIGVQAGCLAVAIVIGALLLGMWLDGQLHTRPWFTLGLLLVSAPLSVYAIYRFALRAARRIQARDSLDQGDKL